MKFTPSTTIYITGRCNLACTYCFGHISEWHKTDTTKEVLKATIDWVIAESGGTAQLHIGYFGGEPLLRPDLIEYCCQYAIEQGQVHKKTWGFSVTSNLTLLTDDVVKLLKKYNVKIIGSIDGMPHGNNQRLWADKQGNSAEVALEKAVLAKDEGILNNLRLTVSPSGLKYLDKDCIQLADMGFRNIAVEFVYEEEWTQGDLQKLEKCLRNIGAYLVEEYRNGRQLHIKPLHDAFNLYRLDTRQSSRCGLGCFGVGIAPDGTIQPCHRFVCRADADKWAFGNVLTGFDRTKRDLMISDWHYDKIKVDDGRLCKDCPIKLRCPGGICPPSHLDVTGDLYTVQHCYCDVQYVCQKVGNDILGVLYGEQNPLMIDFLQK